MINLKSFFKKFGRDRKANFSKDPVCGMKASDAIGLSYQGVIYSFCSDQCRRQFEESPESYIVE